MGNLSKANQAMMDDACGYVASLTPAHHRDLMAFPVELASADYPDASGFSDPDILHSNIQFGGSSGYPSSPISST